MTCSPRCRSDRSVETTTPTVTRTIPARTRVLTIGRPGIVLAVMVLRAGFSPLVADAATDDTPLADAAAVRQWTQLQQLLSDGADPGERHPDGMTALHWAAWHDHTETCRRLLQNGAEASAVTRYHVTPLTIACQNGNAEIVALLLNAGADPNRAQHGGETPLMTASRTGRPKAVTALLAAGADVNAREAHQQTALMWAAAEGHTDVVDALLGAGADFRTPLRSGFTPLLFAVRQGHTDTVRRLMAAGADIHAVMQPEARGPRIARRGTSPLLLAVENAHFELAAMLIEAGADPNDQRSGFAPLHALSWVRKPNLGDGVDGDPPPRGSGDLTSLQFVEFLVAAGADVNLQLTSGSGGAGRLHTRGATPFLMAADTADVPLMTTLLHLGADPTIANVDGATPLMAAAGLGTRAPGEEAGTEDESLAAVTLLLELGCDINTVDKKGETAMHGAAYASFPRMVRFLAEHGADAELWNQKNKHGWTPHLIAEGHRPGNFKPAPATLQAVQDVMREAGAALPELTPRRVPKREDYDATDADAR